MSHPTSNTNLKQNKPLPQLQFTHGQWAGLLTELRRRGKGRNESGAFLLGLVPDNRDEVHDRAVQMIVYYDDLDAECLRGGIELSGSAFDALWQICRENQITVIADVHTHPSDWVAQSDIDRRNPMIAQTGHLAIILPNFAQGRIDTSTIGIYEYLGAHKWLNLGSEHEEVIKLASGNRSPFERIWQYLSSKSRNLFRQLFPFSLHQSKRDQQP